MTEPKKNPARECPSLRAMSLFVDHALSKEQAMALSAHAETCPSCAKRIEQLQTMGQSFERHAQGYADKSRSIQVPLADPVKGSIRNRVQALFEFFRTPVLRRASITALVFILTLSFFQMNAGKSPGPALDKGSSGLPSAAPSAIVKTVDTESSSVMIFETEKEKHTIIWFSEA